MAKRWGNCGKGDRLFLGAPKSLQMVIAAMKLRLLLFGRKVITNLDSILKSRVLSSQSYGFSSGHVCMWELDYKESWDQRIDAFELWCWGRLLRVHWTVRRSNLSILKEIGPEYSLEGQMLKLELQYFDVKSWLTGKTSNIGKDGGHEEKGMTENEMVGWHHWVNGHEFEQTRWDGKRQEVWRAAVHGVTKSQTQLSNWTTTTNKQTNWRGWNSFSVFSLFGPQTKLPL